MEGILSALALLPEAAPTETIPDGSWLSLATAQTMLHGIALKTISIADMADQSAERRKAGIRQEAEAIQTIRSALVPLPTSAPTEPVPEGPWLSLATAQTMLHGIALKTITIADTAGSVGTAGPIGTGDGTPIAPAPDDDAAWNARLIQRMRQSTTTAREPALPPTTEPMASPMLTLEPVEIFIPAPDDDAAWDALFLERIRRQQAAQTAQKSMEEMEKRTVMPPFPPPHVYKRGIDPQMPEW